jgi:nitrogen regulatory protein PII
MKLVFVIFHEIYRERIRELLEELQVPGYTEFRQLSGSGATGRRYDTSVWPGRNAAVMAVVEADAAERVVKELQAFKGGLGTRSARPGGLKIFVLPVEMAA